ncbi:MAG: tetratricopeptide repeat protein [Candidatus Thorarchaeota archaeon]
MKIAKRIILTFVIVSLIPIIAISALSTVTIFNVSNDNAGIAADALESEELANIDRISQDVSEFIEERMQNYIDGVYIMEQYCESLFNGSINATTQYSYYWDPAAETAHSGLSIPGRTGVYNPDYDSNDISFDVSCWYMTPGDPSTPVDPWDWSETSRYFIETSSNMDNIFRALHEANEDYIWLYMGFSPDVCDTKLMRNYPYDNLVYFEDWYGPGDDYDPTIEEWYQNAASITDDSITFTPNYDPSTDWVLSIGRPIRFPNGTLIGVVSADLSMASIQSNVLNIEVLDSGYAYLLGRDGGVIVHPDIDPEAVDIPDLLQLEFGSTTSSEATSFQTLLDDELTTEFGRVQFTKDGVQWHMTHVNVTDDGFVLVLVVPAAEVVAPAQDMLSQVLASTNNLIVILIILLAAVAAVVTVASYQRGQAVVKPIGDMTTLVDKMARQDFTRSISASGSMYEEIGTTVDALLSFQEACRFGNQAFIRGDLNRALSNYMNLLEISNRIGIEVGTQTMYLNIGNVFRQRGDTTTAMSYYQQALDLANAMLKKSKKDGAEEKDAMIRVASVYHNMALVEMDRGQYKAALQHLEDAEAIDTMLRHTLGLAKRYDAMGLIMTKEGRLSQALSRFEEAKSVAEEDGNNRTLAYIRYHMGELFEEQEQWRKAEDAFQDSIDNGNRTEEYPLVVLAMQKLADVLDQLDKPSHEIRRDAERLRRSIQFKKSVVFVIDYSGSMQAQNRMRAAVVGAKEILESQVNPQDQVSIIVFNDTYRELLPLTAKGSHDDERESPIHRALDSLRYPNNATAFYDALGRALEELDKVESSEHRWIIALTDGQDNSSKVYSLDYLEGIFLPKHREKKRKAKTIEGFVRTHHLDVNLIVIGVGEELRAPIEQRIRSPRSGGRMTIEELLESICNNIPQGQYLSVVDSRDVRSDIEKAFQEAAVMMAQLEVGGSTVDY